MSCENYIHYLCTFHGWRNKKIHHHCQILKLLMLKYRYQKLTLQQKNPVNPYIELKFLTPTIKRIFWSKISIILVLNFCIQPYLIVLSPLLLMTNIRLFLSLCIVWTNVLWIWSYKSLLKSRFDFPIKPFLVKWCIHIWLTDLILAILLWPYQNNLGHLLNIIISYLNKLHFI